MVKVARGLTFKGLDFELVEPSGPEDFKRWSPDTGLLPVLEIDGQRIEDSTRILLHVDELHPDPPLFSPDPAIAAQQRQLQIWCEEAFTWYWQRWLRSRERDASAGGSGDTRRASWLRLFWRWIGALGAARPQETPLVDQLRNRCDDLVRFLGDRPFFFADRPSMADLAVYAMLDGLRRVSIREGDRLLAEYPALSAFLTRVEAETGG